MDIESGQTYIAHREGIVNPKPKYHLYLADDIVFLINSNKSYYDFDLPILKNDCSILTKDCYLQVKTIYKFDMQQHIIACDNMSDAFLSRLNIYLQDKRIKKTIPKIYVDRAIGIITTCLEERKKNINKAL